MASNNENTGNDGPILLLFCAVLLCGLIYFVNPFFKEFFLTLKMWEMNIISFIVPTKGNIELLETLRNKPAFDWSFKETAIVGYKVNYYFLPIVFIVMYYSISYIKTKGYIIKRYNKTYTVKTLLQEQKKVWKFLEPIAHLDLLNVNPTTGPWASAKKPQEIALEYKLLNVPNDLNTLNEERAMKYMALQMGDLYTGMDNLPVYIKALVGCFAAQYLEENDECFFALMDIAESFGEDANGKVNFEPGLVLFNKYKDNPKVNAVMNRHAYVYTALVALFTKAGDKGIILSHYFIWLKPHNRTLYFALNCVGREKSFIENAGIFDHFQHESALKRPMAKLFVESAVKGLADELKKVRLREPD